MNIIILAAGERATEDSERIYPIWLGEVDGELVVERKVRALSKLQDPQFIFAFRAADIDAYYLRDIVGQMAGSPVVVSVKNETAGAACTALLCCDAVDMDDELIIASATDQLDVDYLPLVEEFKTRGADAGVLTFPSLHPRYSYVRAGADGWVTECAEKRPISRSANAGFYWFAKASDFFESLKQMIFKDAHVQGKFYICPALNEMILKQRKVLSIPLRPEQYHPLKSADQLNVYGLATEKEVQ
ncbi:glycosyltransferase family 2 protein [Ensifer sp. Root278]|uniref:glycosyltransferase family 2 protein n=1 Tax=Ensifer sp. Root278 TaxID=1736509 RepID=UPI000709345E|nr:glycosyltransferase family 2 protein [Ensifer sp. Root278]KRD63443.1 hypothetical protein ASE60_31370 [Ensifer sp. Root278]